MKIDYRLETLRRKAIILPPGIDFSVIDRAPDRRKENQHPVIVWNHRWEHDKNPERFFEALFDLDSRGFDFGLIVLGQSFRFQPDIFEEARVKLSHRLIHFGYVESRQEYGNWLRKGDVVVSTATHEFFGMAVLEAVRAGCRPLLPNRLSYPEIFPEGFLYDEEAFLNRLIETLERKRLTKARGEELTKRFSWESLANEYAGLLLG